MPLKGAQEFIEEFVRAVRPPQGCAISLTERKQQSADDANWIEGAGIMPADAMMRFGSAAIELRRQHPVIDWNGITERTGEFRRIARYYSEVK